MVDFLLRCVALATAITFVGIQHSTHAEDSPSRKGATPRAEKKYETIPLLAPITAGGPTVALDPPSDDEVMKSFLRANSPKETVPLLYEVQRDNVRISKEKIADYIDPPRVVPLVGPVYLHHAHYKCTLRFSETKWIGWPIPHRIHNDDVVEVIYIDHNHFHMVGKVDSGSGSNY